MMTDRRYRQRKLLFFYTVFTLVILTIICIFIIFSTSDKKKYRNAGVEAFKTGKYEEAIKNFDKALSEKQWFAEKLNLDSKYYKAASYMRLNRYSDAYAIYQELEKNDNKYLNKDALNGLLDLSKTLMDTTDERFGYTDADVDKLQKFAESGNTKMYLYLASIYEKNNDLDKMKEAVEAYIEKEKPTTYTSYLLSSYYLEKDDIDSARKCIETGLSCRDNLYVDLLRFNEAVCYEKEKDYETAFAKISELHNQYPDNKEFLKEYNILLSRVKPDTQFVHTSSDADYFD